jgi:hypothetical protein
MNCTAEKQMRLARAAEGIRFIGPLMKVISFVSKCDFNYFYFEVWPTRFRSASASPDPLRPAGCVSVFGSSSERQMYSPSCWSCPCFLWIFLGGPNIEKLRGNEALTQPYPRSSGGVVGAPETVADFQNESAGKFGEANGALTPNEKGPEVAIEIALPDDTMSSRLRSIPPCPKRR